MENNNLNRAHSGDTVPASGTGRRDMIGRGFVLIMIEADDIRADRLQFNGGHDADRERDI